VKRGQKEQADSGDCSPDQISWQCNLDTHANCTWLVTSVTWEILRFKVESGVNIRDKRLKL
jgi:hypothetical protein